jgi:hypothetical protein
LPADGCRAVPAIAVNHNQHQASIRVPKGDIGKDPFAFAALHSHGFPLDEFHKVAEEKVVKMFRGLAGLGVDRMELQAASRDPQ